MRGKLIFSVIFCAGVLFSASEGVAGQYRLSGSLHGLWGDERQESGSELQGSIAAAIDEKHWVDFGAMRLSRNFFDSSSLTDTAFRGAFHGALWNSVSLSAAIRHSSTSNFLSRWSTEIVPEFYLPRGRVSLGYRWDDFEAHDAHVVIPGAVIELGGRFEWGVKSWLVAHPEILSSARTSISRRYGPGHRLTLGLAAGRTLEAEHLPSQFRSYDLSLSRKLERNLEIHLSASIYRSDVRDENRMGVGMDWAL